MQSLILTTAIIFILEIYSIESIQIQCASCRLASTVEQCRDNPVTCSDSEECFLEKVTTRQTLVAFNAGCRSKTVCRLIPLLNGQPGKRALPEAEDVDAEDTYKEKRQNDDYLVNCVECCDADPNEYGQCNTQLCHQRPNATGKMCLKCANFHPGPNFCTGRDQCQDTQMCHTAIRIIDNAVRYEYGCEEKHLCEALVNNRNKSSSIQTGRDSGLGIKICDACCDDNECNREDCFSLRQKMTTPPLPPP